MFALPRVPIHSATVSSAWLDQFAQQREALGQQIAEHLRHNMAGLVGHMPTADLLLVAADGRKLPAHLCILKQRAPSFFQRYVQATLEAITPRNAHQRQLLEIAVGDVDSAALEFFMRSIYTDEEVFGLLDLGNGHINNGKGKGNDGDPISHPQKHGQNEPGGNYGQTDREMDFAGLQMKPNPTADRATKHPEMRTNRMSASFPSPNSPKSEQFIGDGLISFRDLADSNKTIEKANSSSDHFMECPSNVKATTRLTPKFIGLPPIEQKMGVNIPEAKKHHQTPNSIFPFFIGIGNDGINASTIEEETQHSVMTRSLPSGVVDGQQRSDSPLGSESGSIRSRALAARRLSGCSLNSLASIDALTPNQEFPPGGFFAMDEMRAASKLGQDLLQMLTECADTADVRLVTADDEQPVHSCILWASGSDFFQEQISTTFGPSHARLSRIELCRFSGPSVHFLRQFMYGGLTCLPSTNHHLAMGNEANWNGPLDPWELLELGAFTRLEMFQRVVLLHLRAKHFHFFHRPCASCVSALFEALPKMELEIPAVKELFNEALQWQAAHFTRIWKGRVFLHLAERWQKRCRDALLQSVDEENVVEVLLGCEKLQLTLARIRLQSMAQQVAQMVRDAEEYCLEFLANSLDSLVQSKAFSSYGRGLALNLSLLEDILPPMVHSLSAETTIRAFLALKELIGQLEERSQLERDHSGSASCTNSPIKKLSGSFCPDLLSRSSLHGSNASLQGALWREQWMMNEWNPRFKSLCHRLLELLDRHMLHYANAIVNSPEWALLNGAEQSRIQEFGLFVEMRMPRVAPPRLSSAGRSYKRSSSVGFNAQNRQLGTGERARSLERNSSVGIGGQIAGSRPSLSTQMEEEIADNFGSHQSVEVTKESCEKRVQKSENQKNPAGSKIPAKIGAQFKKKCNENDVCGNKEENAENGQQKIESTNVDAMPNEQQVEQQHPKEADTLIDEDSPKRQKTRRKQFGMRKTDCSTEASTSTEHPRQEAAAGKQVHRNIPTSSAPTISERQRTHTLMTVDQNLKAGINAFLETVGAMPGAHPTVASTARNGAKPQSIVHPMPKAAAPTTTTTAPPASETTNETRPIGRRVAPTKGRVAACSSATIKDKAKNGTRRPEAHARK